MKVPENIEDRLTASGSIMINNDEYYTESENVILTLTPEGIAEYMQFSEDGINWTDWEPFQETREWIFSDNTKGEKIVYVSYKTGDEISAEEYDRILLLPRYDAIYNVLDMPVFWKSGLQQIANQGIDKHLIHVDHS